jgi:biotin carboxyl carrier protein
VPADDDWIVAAALRVLGGAAAPGPATGPRVPGRTGTLLPLACGDATRRLRVDVHDSEAGGGGAVVDVRLDERVARVRVHPVDTDGWRAIEVDGLQRQRLARLEGARVDLLGDAVAHVFVEPSPLPRPDDGTDARRVRAPVAGVVARVAVRAGERVDAGAPLACVEAMKMEMWLPAAAAGTVTAVHAAAGDTVAAGALIVELEPDPA